ncbi:MAG: hypothetical protein QNK36_01695 [Colwellia sp.]|nr:hypothetical protein [Colwellia sp.]
MCGRFNATFYGGVKKLYTRLVSCKVNDSLMDQILLAKIVDELNTANFLVRQN